MSLTTGRGPLSAEPAGRFSAPVPEHLVYVEPFRRRVRAVAAGRTVIDSERVLLVHRQGRPPAYAFPAADVAVPGASPEPAAAGYVQVDWDAVDSWWEEEEEVHMHPRNPYHRVDCVRTGRRLRVERSGVVVVDTTTTMGVYETSLEPRLYAPAGVVRADVLVRSDTTSYCPYKGTASYWDVVVGDDRVTDAVWAYEDPLPESAAIAGWMGFDPAGLTVTADLPDP